jgi:hypothetical protein
LSRAPVALLLALLSAGCATPLHLRPVSLTGDGRTLPDLFLGGWDGRRLDLFDDSSVEPGISHLEDVARALSFLSAHEYGVVYIDKARLTPEEARPHGLFCDAPTCLAVLERRGADDFQNWGATLAIFEFGGPKGDIAGQVWIDGRLVRPPGPKKWSLMCRSPQDQPHFVHPDGGAVYPARPSPGGDQFALFGPSEAALDYKKNGFAAPSDTTCVVEPLVPDHPATKADAGAPQLSPSKMTDPSTDSSGRSHRKKRKRDDE